MHTQAPEKIIPMEDLPLPELSHGNRMNEMLNRPATPPPFPTELPDRPVKPSWPRWRVATTFLAMLLALSVITNAILGSFWDKEKDSTIRLTASQDSLASQLSMIEASTVPQHRTRSVTATVNHTRTETITRTANYVSIFTPVEPPPPEPTCDTMDPLVLGREWCVLVNECNKTTHNTQEHDCQDGRFCEIYSLCAEQWRARRALTMKPQMLGCCGHCGCFDGRHNGVTWLTDYDDQDLDGRSVNESITDFGQQHVVNKFYSLPSSVTEDLHIDARPPPPRVFVPIMPPASDAARIRSLFPSWPRRNNGMTCGLRSLKSIIKAKLGGIWQG